MAASPKNPSTLMFWNDLENDEQLKTCSLAAKGLWDHHMLPIAARSADPGVIMLGNHPSKLDADLPSLLARACGESVDIVVALLRELVDSGAASVDDHGRLYNRRMVREEGIRKARSEAGKRGAHATNAGRQKSGKGVGKQVGKGVGKPPANGSANEPANDAANGSAKAEASERQQDVETQGEIDAGREDGERQNASNDTGDHSSKSAPSSLFMLQEDDLTTTPFGAPSGADAPGDPLDVPVALARGEEGEAVRLWNEAAKRAGWPAVQRMTSPRRRALKARLAECGGIDGWRSAIAKAEASSFLMGRKPRSAGHENWRCDLDFILKQAKFTKLMEGGYDDPPSTPRDSAERSVLAGLAGLAEAGSR
jgi:hypothetical protein